MKNILILALAFGVFGCETNSVSDYFSKLPTSAQLQFGATTTSILGTSWSPYTNFNVGTQPFGSKSQSVIYLANLGQLPAGIQKLWVDSTTTNYYSVSSQCGTVIGAGTPPCAVTVTYTPNTIGSTPATLHVSYTNGNGATSQTDLPLAGSASNLAYLQFQQSTESAPNDTIGYQTSVTFNVLYNGAALGAAGLQIEPAQGVMITNPTNAAFTIDQGGTTCGTVVNADCLVKVDFSAGAAGNLSSNFSMSYFNGAEVLSIPATINGDGLTAAVLATLSGSTTTFPNTVVGTATPTTQLISVNFSGSVPATNVVITGPTDNDFVMSTDPTKSTCFASTSINGNCVISVTFNPVGYSPSSSSILISYNSNGQVRTPASIQIQGTGVHPALLTPNVTTLAFNNDPAHEGTSQGFSFTNSGGVAPANVSVISNSDTSDFNVPGGTGFCNASPNNGTCGMTVGFTPSTAGNLSTNISFTYFDGLVTKTVALTATGTGTSPLVVTGGGTFNFGNVMIGSTVPSNAQFTNLGIFGTTAGTITITPSQLSSPFTFPGGFPGGGSCSTSVDPNSHNSCNFGVNLSTTTNGLTADTPVSQNFTIGYSGSSNTLNYTATMTPRNPPVLAFGTNPSFATISVNNSESANFTITNNSPYFATSHISTGSLSSPFTVTNDGCAGGVVAGGSCAITVKFQPTTAGTFSGTLNYTYSDSLSNHTISTGFSATGSAAVTLAANPTTVDFGNVFVGDTVGSQTIAIQYYGAETWTPGMSGVSAPFSVNSSSCGSAGNCTLTVSLNTSAQVNSANQTLSFTYNNALASGGTGTLSITLKANIQYRQATLSLSPLTFSNTLQGAQNSQTLTLTNTGSGTASSLAINQSLTSGFSVTGGTCLSVGSLAAAGTCTIVVDFAPTAVGALSTALSMTAVSAGSATPVPSSFTLSGNGTQLIKAYAGGYQTCIIDELDNAVCWGRNTSGQLGQGNTNTITTQPKQMAKIAFGSGVSVVKLAVGDSHTCALLNTPSGNGKVSCWGSNGNGRLGLGSSETATSAPVVGGTLQLVNLGTDSNNNAEVATDISAGFDDTCAVLASGKVKCWGGNSNGQLGNGTSTDVGSSSSQMGNALEAVNLGNETPVAISAGASHTCATMSDGATKCWGDNYFGELGQGVSTQTIGASPSDMSGLADISLGNGLLASSISASAGTSFTCALLRNGSVKCFGETDSDSSNNFWGVLGTCWARPIYNSAAVPCWSNTNLAQTTSMGYYSSDMGDDLPVVSLPGAVSELAIGSQFVCTLGNDSNIRCWGMNDHGQLGIGNANNIGAGQNDMGSNLVAALGPSGGVSPVSVVTGDLHTCSVLSNNTVKCWGTSSLNATGLNSFGVATDTGGTSGTLPSGLQVVYDGR